MNEDTKRHLVPCPHCGKDVLDHMQTCPFCQGALTPKGYGSQADPEKLAQFRKGTRIVMYVIAAILIAFILYKRFMGM